MPRYCAVKRCRNRGGTASRQDNKRISFYPFPLQDKPRLQKWVNNMKREEWTPSRHQYLCSEHFTEDCFDIRWGIRYLKNTAIPTVFPSNPPTEDDGEKKCATFKRSPKNKPKTFDIDPTGFDPPLNKRPLILSKTCKKDHSSLTNSIVADQTEMILEPPVVLDTGSCHLNLSEIWTAACDSDEPTASCLTPSPSTEPQSEEQADSIVTVLCCESLGTYSEGEGNVASAGLGQTFSLVPIEMIEDEAAPCFSEEREPCEGEDIPVCEHSYCRPDTDRDQLWRKILSLHAKILELDGREESTVAKIRALETEVALLKRDGAVFKERQKIFEEYISSTLL